MLKKLNIADSRIELTTELASKAGRIVNTLPRDPSLCFKEYTLRAGGGKIRKKNTNFISPKKSLIQINRKWPQCCHSTSSSSTSSSSTCDNCSIDSIKVLKEIKSSENDNEFERILRDLNKRISQLEHEQKRQIEIQNQINHTASKNFSN
ncbi:hypothetical protein PVAND_007043 [Polypedilum vanderplanki]|uniref:Uncharacterized protein n=1 Tax=Polypedilum vanderplanki TaxID=319348 RepID=A0A9J6C607_POLVA|nr:hypothetical protein PVAND_007043 [Polypedilum vanderplanki]